MLRIAITSLVLPAAKFAAAPARALLRIASACLLLAAAAAAATPAAAQERVLLQEVMPELRDTPLGAIDVGPAPALGSSLVVRRSDIQRALAQAGARSSELKIPRSVKVSREVVSVDRHELGELARPALESAVAPCQLRDARLPEETRLARGEREYRAEFPGGLRQGQVTGALFVESAGQSTRVPVVAHLSCPPPEVSTGAQVTARVVVGAVVASAPAEARQPGRTGEIIRIVNRATGANLRGRVIDAQTVEVVP
jgi:hypothetical protein